MNRLIHGIDGEYCFADVAVTKYEADLQVAPFSCVAMLVRCYVVFYRHVTVRKGDYTL